MSYRRLGDLEKVDIPGMPGCVVWMRCIGPGVVKLWGCRMEQLRLDEMRRALRAREGLTREVAPHLFDDHALARGQAVTPEGLEAVRAYAVSVLADCVVRARGHPDLEGVEGAALAGRLAELGVEDLLLDAAVRLQSLTRPEVSPEGPRRPRAGGAAQPAERPYDRDGDRLVGADGEGREGELPGALGPADGG